MTFAPVSLLRRLLTPKPHGPVTDPAEREARRVNETPSQWLTRISKLPR